MRKINKQDAVPESLNSKTTNDKRDEIIRIGEYPTNKTISKFTAQNVSTYNDRYKQKDIKNSLNKLYNGKCAYCETKNRQLVVEHYRAKSEYYWLAYSWDNLLYSCPICNSRKKDKFPIQKAQVKLNQSDTTRIHQLKSVYDDIEQPELINPETDDISEDIIYKENGEFDLSRITNHKLLKTIDLLNLNDKEDLSINRKAIYDKLEKAISERIYEIKQGFDIDNNILCLTQIIENFINDIENEFYTFREYIIKNWIKKMIN